MTQRVWRSGRGWLWVAAALGALLVAAAVAVMGVAALRFNRIVDLPATSFAPGTTAPWLVDLEMVVPPEQRPPGWLLALRADSVDVPRDSRLILLEDGVPAGQAHRVHADLRSGAVGWSHWDRWLILATSGASDPRTSGRRYQLVVVYSPTAVVRWLGFVVGPLLLLAPVAGVLLARAAAGVGSERARSGAAAMALGVSAAVLGVGAGVASLGPLVRAPADSPARWIVAAALLLAGASVSAGRTVAGVRVATRVVATILGLFAATAAINAPLAELERLGSSVALERLAPWLGVGLLAVAWFRPSALAMLVALAGWRRVAGAELTGFPDVSADWLPLAVAGSAIAGGIAAHAWLDLESGLLWRARRLFGRTPSAPAASAAGGGSRWLANGLTTNAPSVLSLVLPLVAALQLGNYLAAAIEKIRISPRGFDWILVNHTEHLALIAEALGAARPLPSSAVGAVHDLMAGARVPLNAAIMLVELLPLVAFVRLRLAVATLLALAAMHVGIFAVTGLCFWKWTLLDLALAAALWRMRHVAPKAWPAPFVLLLTLVMAAWSQSRWAVTLGWFDTPALNRVTYEAILDDGRVVSLPPTFFRCGSYIIGCGNFPRLGSEHFPTDTWATTDDSEIRDAAASRTLAVARQSRFAERAEAAGIGEILRRHHAWALEQADQDGRIAHWRWPHHIWFGAARFPEFDDLDVRRVVAYRLVAESIYLQRGPEGLVESPVLRGELTIPLQRAADR